MPYFDSQLLRKTNSMSATGKTKDPVDKVIAVQQKASDVRKIMLENIDAALNRGEQLEEIELKAVDLEKGAKQFQLNAAKVKNKMWWENTRMKLLIGGIILLVLIIVILLIVYGVKSTS